MTQERDQIVDSKTLKDLLANAPKQKFYESGYEHLDGLIGGFAEGDLIILGGSQKAGKTTLLQSLTKRFAINKVGCLWFSVELSNREFIGRFGDDLPVFYLPKVMPTRTTHLWIEEKIKEAKQQHDINVVFVDHLGMIIDEDTARERNSVDILDARLQRLKRFAIEQKVCMIVVAPFVSTSLRKKTTEPDTGDFRGTAMIGYTADTLLALVRKIGRNKTKIVNDSDSDLSSLSGGDEYLIATDAHLHILDSRRTGARKLAVRMILDEKGDYIEA